MRARLIACVLLLGAFGVALGGVTADQRWCLGMGGLGPIRAGMTADDVLPLADWPGLPHRPPGADCWYMRYQGGASDFSLMMIGGRVARIEISGASTLRTFAGARVGTREEELRKMYGARLDVQPHKYDEHGHTFTLKSGGGDYGLRFETSHGRVTAIQAGPWEHLNYVEGCS